MDNFIKRTCVEDAVYWGNPVPDGYGQYEFNDPKKIKVRWEDKIQVVTDTDGKEVTSSAQIFTPSNLNAQGFIWKGNLADLTQAQKDDPLSLNGARQIINKMRVPALGSRSVYLNKVFL